MYRREAIHVGRAYSAHTRVSVKSLASPPSLTIALSKGRICDQALPLLSAAGIEPLEDLNTSRKLRIDTTLDQVKLLVIRATDVPVFVGHGAADLGIVGKDTLLEYDGAGLYEPLDLGIARCRLMVAERADAPVAQMPSGRRLRIATKYERTAHRHYAAKGQQVEIIKLYGSMELAPLVGLADCIVDLVDTGSTLAANGLVAVEHIADVSSHLVVNQASMKMKHAAVTAIIGLLANAVNERDRTAA
jgi:ATP phosphoribosyltransferase